MEQDLGHRLAMLRHTRRLPQHEVAKAVGITQKHLSQLEHGRVKLHSLGGGTVLKLARYFGVSTDYILGMDLPEEPETSEEAA